MINQSKLITKFNSSSILSHLQCNYKTGAYPYEDTIMHSLGEQPCDM